MKHIFYGDTYIDKLKYNKLLYPDGTTCELTIPEIIKIGVELESIYLTADFYGNVVFNYSKPSNIDYIRLLDF